MKSTWPTREFGVGDPTPPKFHLLAFRVGVGGNANFSIRVGGNANFSVLRYQHVHVSNVSIPKATLWCWGSKPKRAPNE